MPQERKQRGRRGTKKRKLVEDDFEGVVEHRDSRMKQDNTRVTVGSENDEAPQWQTNQGKPEEPAFYGLLNEQEQEYFKQADTLLENDQFNNAEERTLFLDSVYKEANGKELKLANSQSCSRLLERLVILSEPDQLAIIFQKFQSHFLNLVQHRFASHCCEALIIRSALFVDEHTSIKVASTGDQHTSSIETGFLSVVAELQPHFGFLITHQFASHVIRILLVILSGLPLPKSGRNTTLQSKKKERILVSGRMPVVEGEGALRTVPASFHTALNKIQQDSLAGLDTSSIRALATHPIANPVLQILLELELTLSEKQSAKQPDSLLRKLFPDAKFEKDTESGTLVKHLLYDAIGSRLLEVIVSQLPGKLFKSLYRNLLREEITSLAKNEFAVFVLIKVLERLSKADLQTAVEQVCSSFAILIERSRTIVIKTLIERSRKREIDTQIITRSFQKSCGERIHDQIRSMVMTETVSIKPNPAHVKALSEGSSINRVHGSLLVQTMLEVPDSLRELVNSALLASPQGELLRMAKDRAASRVLQAALTCREQGIAIHRQLIQVFLGSASEIATDLVASHLLDAIWEGSLGLNFLREKIANELAQNETSIRQSISGRSVWRNWKMDAYKRRRKEWLDEGKPHDDMEMTGIELARARHAQQNQTGQVNHRKKQ